MMLKDARFLFALAVFVFLCVGCACGNSEQHELEQAAILIKDPSKLLYAFTILTVLITWLLFFFGDYDLWPALLNGLRYTSLVAAVVAPLYAIMLDSTIETSKTAGIAMELTGLIGIAATSLFLWGHKRARSVPARAPSDDEEGSR